MGPEPEGTDARCATGRRSSFHAVVAGPSSSITIPGLMTAEVVGALGLYARVTKVAVDPSKDYDSGLHLAKSLSSLYHVDEANHSFRNSRLSSQRRVEFRRYFKEPAQLAVALAWPGLDNAWIGEFVEVAHECGARVVVMVVTHPSTNDGAFSVAKEVADADLVLVGDIMDATLLSASMGKTRPVIEVQRALSLTGRSARGARKELSTFLPKDDERGLLSVLTAFDANPSEWIQNYKLRVIMRYTARSIPDHIAASYFADRVELIGEDFSALDMQQLVSNSSTVSIADPAIDSRALATAVETGISTVVLTGGITWDVGRGYVGGFLADINRPTSIYVAQNHALRLSELRFPSPGDWLDLAARLDAVVVDVLDGLNETASL
ncbi:MAG: hypothetical protein HIU84_02365 [Acidobacteria bacterium]|nr:hypothetical protein [Acidobacteriota bacterium]